ARRAGTRIRRSDGRITRPASCTQDEGIVRPVSKEMDQLSRRLHHHTPPGRPGGVFLARVVGTRPTCRSRSPTGERVRVRLTRRAVKSDHLGTYQTRSSAQFEYYL